MSPPTTRLRSSSFHSNRRSKLVQPRSKIRILICLTDYYKLFKKLIFFSNNLKPERPLASTVWFRLTSKFSTVPLGGVMLFVKQLKSTPWNRWRWVYFNKQRYRFVSCSSFYMYKYENFKIHFIIDAEIAKYHKNNFVLKYKRPNKLN